MQEVGRRLAAQEGFHIESVIGDVHKLPFPDNHFDVVTLQWASRHLRIMDVAREIHRVLKPGGHFYHCDMLRPGNRTIERMYYVYLRVSLSVTAVLFRSGMAARNCKKYFIDTLSLFYSGDIDGRPQSSHFKYTTGRESDRPMTLALGAPQRGHTMPDVAVRLAMRPLLLTRT